MAVVFGASRWGCGGRRVVFDKEDGGVVELFYEINIMYFALFLLNYLWVV